MTKDDDAPLMALVEMVIAFVDLRDACEEAAGVARQCATQAHDPLDIAYFRGRASSFEEVVKLIPDSIKAHDLQEAFG